MSSIQAIGRCAASIPEVTATCLSGLVHLMSSSDQVTLSFLQVLVGSALAFSRTFDPAFYLGGGGGGHFVLCCGLFYLQPDRHLQFLLAKDLFSLFMSGLIRKK